MYSPIKAGVTPRSRATAGATAGIEYAAAVARVCTARVAASGPTGKSRATGLTCWHRVRRYRSAQMTTPARAKRSLTLMSFIHVTLAVRPTQQPIGLERLGSHVA